MSLSDLPPNGRRHDLDALRAFAMLLGIGLHAALSFTPFPWPVQDTRQNEFFGLLFVAVHGFRMPLFFLLSGFFTAMLWRRWGLWSLIRHRFRRIFLPLLLGMVTVTLLLNWSFYLSDASYWLYVAHLPLIVFAQIWVREWPLPAVFKLCVVCVAVSGALLLVYQFAVRYTWIGRLLNGPRERKVQGGA